MRKRTVTLLLTMLVGVTGGAAPPGAEWNLDLYGGAEWIQSSDLKVRGEDDTHAVNLFPGFQITDKDLKYKANINSHSVVMGVSFRF